MPATKRNGKATHQNVKGIKVQQNFAWITGVEIRLASTTVPGPTSLSATAVALLSATGTILLVVGIPAVIISFIRSARRLPVDVLGALSPSVICGSAICVAAQPRYRVKWIGHLRPGIAMLEGIVLLESFRAVRIELVSIPSMRAKASIKQPAQVPAGCDCKDGL
ncbi:hypothetical protein CI109_106056 [Kwoniella shandongensis]|uniref:Uncharacterized protein n=1 Tax=Kwoniella shandongensis TaxID=1734106 RepID=A0A5M6C0U8_9TREE|nr:uncharacterized protein CI109_003891 [Kwoniella shandongensis]KAA5527632.1 hypothetical protein CI109_003891 [Kwoniella shandongensis]